MIVAILSDVHDNLPRLQGALDRASEAEVLLCCGDLCSPFVIGELGRGFGGPIHVVFGNNDGDRFRMTRAAAGHAHVVLHGEFAELEFGGRRFALHHYDDVGRALARSGQYDVVCFGHNHRFEVGREGRTLIVNPGEVYGGLTGASTFVLYDTDAGEARRVDL